MIDLGIRWAEEMTAASQLAQLIDGIGIFIIWIQYGLADHSLIEWWGQTSMFLMLLTSF